VNRAFWTYTVCHTNSEPCQRYADQSVKIMRFGPQTSPYRAYTLPTGSNGADHWRIIQLVSWAFRGCVGSLVNFSPKFRCDQEGVQKRRFGPQTSPYRPYILPTGSNGADHWRILQLASENGLSKGAWFYMFISRQNTAVTRGVLRNGDLALKRHHIEHILSPRALMALIIGASCSA